MPEADEYRTFYPDGTGLRHIIYTPKLESVHRKWHELTEMVVIAGSLTHPVGHMASPALTVLNLEGDADDYHLTSERALDSRTNRGRGLRSTPNARTNQWNQVIMAEHVKNGPDAFNVFSNAQDTPETYYHYRVFFLRFPGTEHILR